MGFCVSENPTVEVSSSYLQKCGILYFLSEERSRMRVYFIYLFFYFPRGDRINPVILEYRKWAHLNGH